MSTALCGVEMGTTDKERARGRGSPLFGVIELVLVIISLGLVWKVHALSSKLQAVTPRLVLLDSIARFETSRAQALETDRKLLRALSRTASLGSQVLLEGTDLDSNTIVVRPQGNGVPLVIYSVDPDCRPCISNIPFLNELLTQTVCPVNVVGVLARNPHLIDEARRLHSVSFPILRASSGRAWSIFPLAESPTLVGVNADGSVIDWWRGELTTNDKERIRSELRASCSGNSP
jgi:hypothetical protein